MKPGPESAVKRDAFQDLLPHNHCYGCGPKNPNGLRIKSYWSGDAMSVARFTPMPYHCAGPKHFVNGGIIATILDCHCVCTAAAMTYRDDGREIGSQPDVYCATTRLEVEYRRPTPMGVELTLVARIRKRLDRGYVLSCSLEAAGKECVTAEVEAVRVPASWILGPSARN